MSAADVHDLTTLPPDPPTDPGKLIALRDVPRLKWLPRRRGGTRLAISTVHRWADPARPVHLQTVRVGGCRATTRAWLLTFFAAQNAADDTPATTVRTPARRAREVAHAEADLAAAGIL